MNTLKLKHLSAAWPLISATALLMPAAASAQLTKTPPQAAPELTPCYAKDLSDCMLCGSIRRPLDAAATSQGVGIDIHFAVLPAINPLKPF